MLAIVEDSTVHDFHYSVLQPPNNKTLILLHEDKTRNPIKCLKFSSWLIDR